MCGPPDALLPFPRIFLGPLTSVASRVDMTDGRSAATNEGNQERRGWWAENRARLGAALRVLFGLIWVIDGAMKFVFMVPSDVTDLIARAGQGQPDWLAPWFNYWSGVVSANPSFWLYGIGALELVVGIFLVIGLLRKPVYVGGIALSLMIWAVDEGFGGAYGAGSTDIGAAVMYAVIFFALLVVDAFPGPSRYSLDAWVERRFPAWHWLAETGRGVEMKANH